MLEGHSVNSIIAFLVLALLTACGGTWVIKEDSDPIDIKKDIQRMAIIERHDKRQSPEIKYFYQFQLEIEKKCAGSDYNTTYCPNRVLTLPGKVYIGSPLHIVPFKIYYPDIKFNVEAGRKYILTWVCAPYPVAVIADSETLKIIAFDSYCPDCDHLYKMTINKDNKCVGYVLHPPDMKAPDYNWIPWRDEVIDYYRTFNR